MPAGRPSKYEPEFAEQAKKLCKLGATDANLADFFGVDIYTVRQWMVRYEEFHLAVKINKGEGDDLVVRSLFMRANGYMIRKTRRDLDKDGNLVELFTEEWIQPDTAAAFIWLKNRRSKDWRDKHEIDGTLNVNHTGRPARDYTSADLDEVQREYAEALGTASQVQSLGPPTSH